MQGYERQKVGEIWAADGGGGCSCVKSAHCSFKISHFFLSPFLCTPARMLTPAPSVCSFLSSWNWKVQINRLGPNQNHCGFLFVPVPISSYWKYNSTRIYKEKVCDINVTLPKTAAGGPWLKTLSFLLWMMTSLSSGCLMVPVGSNEKLWCPNREKFCKKTVARIAVARCAHLIATHWHAQTQYCDYYIYYVLTKRE